MGDQCQIQPWLLAVFRCFNFHSKGMHILRAQTHKVLSSPLVGAILAGFGLGPAIQGNWVHASVPPFWLIGPSYPCSERGLMFDFTHIKQLFLPIIWMETWSNKNTCL
ncbi:hypothetical protein L1049_015949 [Liquidambar formosana]|uniref:Uncharacterized protein n=1 Tax=Liquidambar formosana TaxID=63359 RepID=A0AAP0X6G7_LIQFO